MRIDKKKYLSNLSINKHKPKIVLDVLLLNTKQLVRVESILRFILHFLRNLK